MSQTKSIANILGSDLKSSTLTIENITRIMTAAEARHIDVDVDDSIKAAKCQFCNKDIEPLGRYVYLFNKKSWLPKGEYERCTCIEATKYHEGKDREAAERKAADEIAEQEKAYIEKLDRLMNKSRLGKRFLKRNFTNFITTKDNQKAYNAAKKYADNFKKYKEEGIGMMLVGTNGTGKTHLAASICHSLISQSYQPVFGTMITLLDKIKASFDDDKETEEAIMSEYINCDLLVIDDLGEEKVTEWALEKLYNIINCRYEKFLPVIITTNYQLDFLKRRLTIGGNEYTASAIVSRMQEMCKGIEMNYDDFRKL